MSEIENTKLVIKRGDTVSYTLEFVDEDDAIVNITDWTIFFTVKENIEKTDDDATIKKTITSHLDAVNGKTKISLTSDDTNHVGNYIFDIQIKNSLGEIKTILEGLVTFTKDITRRTS